MANFGGLGIVIGIRENDLTVIAPLEGTPAYQAVIKAKDKIIQIGEESTINMGLTEAVEKLRGTVGSKVSLVVTRTGTAAPLHFTLTRALIHIQSVGGRLLDGKKIGLLKIKNFQEDTLEQFLKTLRSFEREGGELSGLILDLRNNPGGLLDQAVAISDFFLSDGVIVKTVGANGEPLEVEKATPGDEGEEMPVVVIVNEGSASASEIVAGALQFNDRAVVIGNRSFGKGSVQTVYDLKDGSALKLTIAKYLTAHDQQVQSIGINPDVGLIPTSVEPKTVDLFEDVKRRELDLEEPEEDEIHREPNLPPSPLQMTYLGREKTEEEDDNAGKIELEGDFPVLLASRLLTLPESGSLDRQSVIKKIPPLLDELRTGEQEKIRAALSKIGVDWSPGPKDGKPAGVVSLELLDEKEAPRKGLEPGESGFLRVTVENRGSAPFYQLAGVTKSDDPLFANLEFPFGKLDPQEKRTWKIPLKIPNFVHRRSVPVDLTFHEEYDRPLKASPFSLQIDEPPAPLFEYSYRIIDDGSKGSSGNGNRLIDKGETIGLLIRVKNAGPGASRLAIVNLKKVEGDETFIEKGRQEIKDLAPGGESELVLRFHVPAQKVPEKISFDLNIHDSHLGEDLTDRLEFSAGPPVPPQEALNVPPRIETYPADPPLVVQGENYPLKGKAIDDQEVKHLFIFVGDEKVFYQSPPESEAKSASLSFDTTLPLKKGANLITLAAQDDRELTSRKQWIVWREK